MANLHLEQYREMDQNRHRWADLIFPSRPNHLNAYSVGKHATVLPPVSVDVSTLDARVQLQIGDASYNAWPWDLTPMTQARDEDHEQPTEDAIPNADTAIGLSTAFSYLQSFFSSAAGDTSTSTDVTTSNAKTIQINFLEFLEDADNDEERVPQFTIDVPTDVPFRNIAKVYENIVKAHVQRANDLNLNAISFSYGNRNIDLSDTPRNLGIRDGDFVMVHFDNSVFSRLVRSLVRPLRS